MSTATATGNTPMRTTVHTAARVMETGMDRIMTMTSATVAQAAITPTTNGKVMTMTWTLTQAVIQTADIAALKMKTGMTKAAMVAPALMETIHTGVVYTEAGMLQKAGEIAVLPVHNMVLLQGQAGATP